MITVEGVTKTYGGRLAIDDVSFVVEPGRVTGFLGPEGAGKSTTMRIMVGLTLATSGRVTIGGRRYTDLPNPGLLVGVHLHAGGQPNGRTGQEWLAISARTMGLPAARVQEMLEFVSLTPSDARHRMRSYPPDLQQRLSIAHALLGNPAVLILDEPQRGMSPAGKHWIRKLLREHAASGGTVVISTDLLDDVDKIADDLILIAHGRVIAQGSKQELLAARGSYVRAVEQEPLVDALRRANIHTIRVGEGLRSDAEPARIGDVAATAGLRLVELRPAGPAALENLFSQPAIDTKLQPTARA